MRADTSLLLSPQPFGMSPCTRTAGNKARDGFSLGFLPFLQKEPSCANEHHDKVCKTGFPLEKGDYSQGITGTHAESKAAASSPIIVHSRLYFVDLAHFNQAPAHSAFTCSESKPGGLRSPCKGTF